nr:hypothetical protein [Tanacetum cinerariifolium]
NRGKTYYHIVRFIICLKVRANTNLKFRYHKKVDKEIMEGVVGTWLIRCHRKKFEEYMEIKRGDDDEVLTFDEFSDFEEENLCKDNEIVEIFRIETDVFNFETLLCKEFKKFNHILHIDVDYANNALWLYWKRGDDDEVLTFDEFSDFEEENLCKDNEIVEIFRIETDVFNFETLLCKEFKKFNHILHIDVDVLTGDLLGFKTYKDYKKCIDL